ncbi:MAG TPA: ABC transporter family substrate-binding protein [Propioniciclava tarda]|nr:ABC transporter family substrate-binding protein [Propioniciclava tarda]
MNRKLLAAATAVVAGALALGGCTPTPTTSGTTAAPAVKTGGEVNVAWNQAFESYNNATQDQNATANANITYMANDSIGYYDKDLKVIQNPSFGKYEKLSDNPLKVKVTLADTATWSDGTPVTAADMILQWVALSGNRNTYEPTLDDNGLAPANAGTQVYFNAASIGYKLITDMPEVGDNGKSATFTYSKPYVDWEISAMTPVGVPAHITAKKALSLTDNTAAAQAVIDAVKNKDAEKLGKIANFWNTGYKFMNMPTDKDIVVGSGPFTITDAKEKQYITLSKNPNYKGSHKANLDKITVRFIADAQASVQALQNGEVLVTQPQATADILKQVTALKDVTVQTAAGGTYEHVDMAQNNGGPFDPKAYGGDANKAKLVRQAFLTSIPRQKIIDNLIKPLNPNATIRNSFTTVPSSPAYAAIAGANGMEAAYGGGDSAKAKTILASAGLATPPTVRFLYASTNTRRQQEFQLIKEAAEAAGFKVEDKSAEKWGSLLPDTTKYDATLFGWQSTSLAVGESDANYRTKGQNNYYGYSNPAVDKLFDELLGTTESAKQTEILGKIEKLLVDDAFGTTIFQFPEITTSSNKLKNVSATPLSPNFFWNAWEWQLA